MSERQESGKRTRLRARERDEVLAPGVCTYCGEDGFPLTVDHIIPVTRGGTNEPTNLTAACWPCNKEKLDFTLEEWKAWREETGKPWPPQSKSAFITEQIKAFMPWYRAAKAAEAIQSSPGGEAHHV